MRQPAFIESMTKILHGSYEIRIWREEAVVLPYYPDTHKFLFNIVKGIGTNDDQIGKVLEELTMVERVTAVELVHCGSKNGVVLYMEWP